MREEERTEKAAETATGGKHKAMQATFREAGGTSGEVGEVGSTSGDEGRVREVGRDASDDGWLLRDSDGLGALTKRSSADEEAPNEDEWELGIGALMDSSSEDEQWGNSGTGREGAGDVEGHGGDVCAARGDRADMRAVRGYRGDVRVVSGYGGDMYVARDDGCVIDRGDGGHDIAMGRPREDRPREDRPLPAASELRSTKHIANRSNDGTSDHGANGSNDGTYGHRADSSSDVEESGDGPDQRQVP